MPSKLKVRKQRRTQTPMDTEKRKPDEPDMTIEPLVKFDWKTTEPRKLRPWKAPYHITMGRFSVDFTHGGMADALRA